MADELFELPVKPFFSCEEDNFAIADGALMHTVNSLLSVEPLLKLMVGSRNLFEHRPLRVTEHEGNMVTVECEAEETVYLDFHELTARKRTPQGEYIYFGGIEEGNDGMGFIAAR